MRHLVLVVSAGFLAACGPPKWVGTYTTSETWDLGGPLFGGRTVGDSATDLVVEQTLSLLGVPSFAEADATRTLDALVRPGIKAVVDPAAPPELSPGGSVYVALASALASVKTESTLVLAPVGLSRDAKGQETFTAFEWVSGGMSHRLEASAVAGQSVVVEAEWSGKERGADSLEIETHAVELRLGELVKRVALVVVDALQQSALKDQVLAAVSCDRIVTRLTMSGDLAVNAAGQTFPISEMQLRRACDQAVSLVADRVLGLIKLDSKVEIGGTVTIASPGLQSVDGFGGVIAIAPRAIAPRLAVSLTATRAP